MTAVAAIPRHHDTEVSLNNGSSQASAFCTDSELHSFDLTEQASSLMYDNIDTYEYVDLSDIPVISSKNELFLTHLNIRSLKKNFDDLFPFLSQLPVIPHIICLSKIKTKDMPSVNISLPGYSFINVNSPTIAGGVSIYISDTCNHQQTFSYSLNVRG